MPLKVALALALLLTPAAAQAPAAEQVKSTVDALKSAFAKSEVPARLQAIEAAIAVVDPAVIQALEKGLKDDDENVRAAVVSALRDMRHPQSLKALHAELERAKKAQRGSSSDHWVSVVKAIAAHAAPDSVEVLTKDVFASLDPKLLSARILALGNIRSLKSVEALMSMMKMAGPAKVQPYMDELRLALVVLTGADQGKSQEAWTRWWNDNKKSFELLAKAPALAKEDARRWYTFLDERPLEERQKRRAERGSDPEGGTG